MFFAALSLVMVGWVVRNVVTIRPIERPYTLRGEFAATGGVARNAEVTYLGVPVGTVTGVERITGGVLVSMDIDRGFDIPLGATANIQRKSAIGEPIVDFRPPPGQGDGGPSMPKSSTDFVVPMDQTTVPLELSELLRSASRLPACLLRSSVQTGDGRRSPMMFLSRTDLPVPEGPRMAAMRPLGTSNEMSFRTWCEPKCLLTPRSEMTGSGGTSGAGPGSAQCARPALIVLAAPGGRMPAAAGARSRRPSTTALLATRPPPPAAAHHGHSGRGHPT